MGYSSPHNTSGIQNLRNKIECDLKVCFSHPRFQILGPRLLQFFGHPFNRRDWVSQSERLEFPDPSTSSKIGWIKLRRHWYASALRYQEIASEHSYFSNFPGGAPPDPPSKTSRLRPSLYGACGPNIVPFKVDNDYFSPQLCNLLIKTQIVLHWSVVV